MDSITIILIINIIIQKKFNHTASLSKSASLDLNNSCKCSELIYSTNCYNGFSDCSWNTHKKQCVDMACSDIEHCIQSSNRSYWLNKQCHDFTFCKAIPGKDQSECIAANIYFPAQNGINCLSMEYLQKCSDTKDPDIWQAYNLVRNCGLIKLNLVCYFDAQSYMCKDMTCSRQNMESQCQFGAPTIGPY